MLQPRCHTGDSETYTDTCRNVSDFRRLYVRSYMSYHVFDTHLYETNLGNVV